MPRDDPAVYLVTKVPVAFWLKFDQFQILFLAKFMIERSKLPKYSGPRSSIACSPSSLSTSLKAATIFRIGLFSTTLVNQRVAGFGDAQPGDVHLFGKLVGVSGVASVRHPEKAGFVDSIGSPMLKPGKESVELIHRLTAAKYCFC